MKDFKVGYSAIPGKEHVNVDGIPLVVRLGIGPSDRDAIAKLRAPIKDVFFKSTYAYNHDEEYHQLRAELFTTHGMGYSETQPNNIGDYNELDVNELDVQLSLAKSELRHKDRIAPLITQPFNVEINGQTKQAIYVIDTNFNSGCGITSGSYEKDCNKPFAGENIYLLKDPKKDTKLCETVITLKDGKVVAYYSGGDISERIERFSHDPHSKEFRKFVYDASSRYMSTDDYMWKTTRNKQDKNSNAQYEADRKIENAQTIADIVKAEVIKQELYLVEKTTTPQMR